MSASVKAALAAKRAGVAAHGRALRSASPIKRSGSSRSTLNESSDMSAHTDHADQGDVVEEADISGFAQVPMDKILLKACQTGRVNVATRLPALKALPEEIYALISGSEPGWYDRGDSDRAWYEREEIRSLQANGNALHELDERIGEFRALLKIELQQNELVALPQSFLNLWHLTVLNLSANNLTCFPTCLLALDNLKNLDLSSNKLKSLWSAEDILASRGEKKRRRAEWESENGPIDEDGMWSGFLSGPSSPIKKSNKLLPQAVLPPTTPMHALRTLCLGRNRLGGATFGLAGATAESEIFVFPSRLRVLDLSDNDICGPVSYAPFAALPDLQELNLSGNGVSDQVFAIPADESAPLSTLPVFSSLALLHLARCDIDDLAPLQAVFDSGNIREQDSAVYAAQQEATGHRKDSGRRVIARKQIIKVKGSPSQALKDTELHVVLDGNPLREEEFKKKRTPGYNMAQAQAESKGADTGPGSGSRGRSTSRDGLRGRQSSGFEPVGGDHGSPGTPNMNTLNESGAFKARRSPSTEGSSLASHATEQPSALAMQAQMQGIQIDNAARQQSMASTQTKSVAVQKEEWELLAEAGLLTEGGKRRARAEQARRAREMQNRIANKAGIPSFGNTEVLPTKSLAQGQGLPNAESGDDTLFEGEADAGSALANAKLSNKKKEALSQVPCKFFRSNGCSAGSACPFAHTIPGEGLQKATCQWFLKGNCRFGHKCALAHIFPGQPISMDRKNKRAMQHGLPLPSLTTEHQRNDSEISRAQAPQTPTLVPPYGVDPSFMQQQQQPRTWPAPEGIMAPPARDGDLMFGMPDDLRGPSSAREIQAALPGTSPSAHRAGPLRFTADQAIHSGSPGSRAFGTSPFSQGGHVFYSGSQGSDADFAAQGQMRFDLHKSHDDDDEQLEEDFLPSSLSELLTPEERVRRARSNRAAQSLPTSTGIIKDQWPAQSADDTKNSALETAMRLGLYSSSPSNTPGGSRFAGLMARTGSGYNTVDGSSSFGGHSPNPLPPHAYSPASRAALGQHAPGQSLPRGLAAGLSRLHLKQGEEIPMSHVPTNLHPLSSRYTHLDDLTPIAPSSVLPHRQTFGLDAGFSSLASLGTSPQSFGALRGERTDLPGMPIPASSNGAPAAFQAPQVSPSKSAVSRLRGIGPLAGSPLATSGGSRKDEDEDTIFQFE
ncbi:hypothetical protein K437DRAFT_262389 [Tilletiaria anomala UBC 951]|uniref:C3H1-type domain-containing protein n=1 Tax=Tilletiaria anomala (strain ATCC 24038 / CBS 436.72 / UBC 951) TaxID=1037660 RepID=A0A066W5C3_TILAU|nr:uncharacterized protein K437DRAFT_262389 [Tilletiaria anomala UBC 951]KDN47743.1 hypothetical protein K437DRAFT_262389 [Tilletiaria anomala UBC 951]